MTESLDIIRTLMLAPVFEDLYLGRDVPANLQIYMRYPSEFRNATLDEWKPLTQGGLVPIVDDGNFYNICLFDPRRRKFVVKSVEEPEQIVTEFDSWQSYLAYALLEIADSGPSEAELIQIAETVGFQHTADLLSLLDEMENLSDQEIDQRTAQFIRACAA
jgi:hypothetical protein